MPTNSPARPDSPSRPDLEGLRKLDTAATPAPWCVYSEPEVGLPPSLFSGTVMESGFGPIEPLTGYDLDLVATMRNALPSLIAHVERLESLARSNAETFDQFAAALREHDPRLFAQEIAVAELCATEATATLYQGKTDE